LLPDSGLWLSRQRCEADAMAEEFDCCNKQRFWKLASQQNICPPSPRLWCELTFMVPVQNWENLAT